MANYCNVIVRSANRTIVPWTVVIVEPSSNFENLFSQIKSGKFSNISTSLELSLSSLDSVYIGKDCSTANSSVDKTVNIVSVCVLFGWHIKFVVSVLEQGESSSQPVIRNAFSIMMESQRRICSQTLPEPVPERTKKDKLFNDLLKLAIQRGLKLPSGQIESGKRYFTTITSALWYIDGHHATLFDRGCKIPELFKEFKDYNTPESSKHRKRHHVNLDSDKLTSLVSLLYDQLLLPWLKTTQWSTFYKATELLANSCNSYLQYLKDQSKKMKAHHSVSEMLVKDNVSVQLLKANPKPSSCVNALDVQISAKNPYEHLYLADLIPSDRRERYFYIQELKRGLSHPCVLCTCSIGGPIGNYLFLWPLPAYVTMEAALNENQKVIAQIQKDVPTYHRRAFRRKLISAFGRISPKTNLATFREFYRAATGDLSSSLTTAENEIDKRLREAIEMEDPDVIVDLRELNKGHSSKFTNFWEKMKVFLNESSAVHERRHGQTTYMAKAISVRDLVQQVSQMCPGEPLPSEQWVRLQFCPRNPRAKVASQYTSQFNVKMMIQKRQFRHDHIDAHYCAALFRYMREFAIRFRHLAIFASLDDKHRIKVGEPNYPVAAAERGRRVIVAESRTFEVGDHDFTKFSIIPSVSFVITIPETIEGSWYEGEVFIGFKDAVFEPSSALRHVTELHSTLVTRLGNKSVLFVYTDGGPDHRLTFMSVQLSMVALFLNLNLDLLVVGRTAPNHSWRNPVERVMSVINLGLQCVGVMRTEGSSDFEKAIKNANNLKALRRATEENYKDDVKGALTSPLNLLENITKRLELKGKPFSVFESATDDEIYAFWEVLNLVDESLSMDDNNKSILDKKEKLKAFFEHCCQIRRYSFCVKKCGAPDCNICKPVRIDTELFKDIHFLPDPKMGVDGHYIPIVDIYGTNTNEDDCPSLTKRKKAKSLTYSPTETHARNVGVVVQCDECNKWRLLFSKRKLSAKQRQQLEEIIADVSYSCGATTEDLILPEALASVCIRAHECSDHIEKIYYSAYKDDPLCIHCGSTTSLNIPSESDSFYHFCDDCSPKERIYKRTSKN